jgi:hypothetical protein
MTKQVAPMTLRRGRTHTIARRLCRDEVNGQTLVQLLFWRTDAPTLFLESRQYTRFDNGATTRQRAESMGIGYACFIADALTTPVPIGPAEEVPCVQCGMLTRPEALTQDGRPLCGECACELYGGGE